MAAACRITSDKDKSEDDASLGIKSANERKEANQAKINEMRSSIKDGDLILRTGTDFSSEQVKLLSLKDKTYSHGGIAVHDSGDIYIYHVVPDYFHFNDKVRKEKLDSFCNPAQNLGFAHARYNLEPAETKVFIEYLDKQYQQKVPFDMRFHLSTDDSLYCSEMVKKGLILATNNRIRIENIRFNDSSKFKMVRQHFKVKDKDFVGREIVPIDNLFLHPSCQVIKRYVFE